MILSIHLALLVRLAFRYAPTVDEPAYLAAGIAHLKHGRFEPGRVTPPLVRMIGALPIVCFLDVPTGAFVYPDNPGSRAEWSIGPQLVRCSGRRIFSLISTARCACIAFSLLGACTCYLWAREAYGDAAGTTALVLWCFSPEILGHGALLTPDIGGAATGLLANFFFWRWLCRDDAPSALAMGAALGAALLCRSTWLILIPLWIVLTVVLPLRPSDRHATARRLCWTFGSIVLALHLLNLGYAYRGSFQELGNFEFVSGALGGELRQRPDGYVTGNRFHGTPWARLRVPFPRDFLLGIDMQRREFESGGWSYLAGKTRPSGWWHYYLYGLAVKLPLPTLALALLAFGTVRCPPATYEAGLSNLVVLAAGVVVLVAASSQSGFSHHVRYSFGILPCIYVWAARCAVSVHPLARAARGGSLVWLLISSLSVYPHSLAYFNELAGGPANGHRHLVDSNLDWGQDLWLIREWIDKHPSSKPAFLAYYGGVPPALAGIRYRLPPIESGPGEGSSRAPQLKAGRYIVSATFAAGRPFWVYDADGNRVTVPPAGFSYFRNLQPVERIGHSTFVYERRN